MMLRRPRATRRTGDWPRTVLRARRILPDLSDVSILAGVLVLLHTVFGLSHVAGDFAVGILLTGIGVARSGIIRRGTGDRE